jgi:hypothetical protein
MKGPVFKPALTIFQAGERTFRGIIFAKTWHQLVRFECQKLVKRWSKGGHQTGQSWSKAG